VDLSTALLMREGGSWRIEVDLGKGMATREAFLEKMAVVVMILPGGAALFTGFRRAGAGLLAVLVVVVGGLMNVYGEAAVAGRFGTAKSWRNVPMP